jgi:hypothetical protein
LESQRAAVMPEEVENTVVPETIGGVLGEKSGVCISYASIILYFYYH